LTVETLPEQVLESVQAYAPIRGAQGDSFDSGYLEYEALLTQSGTSAPVAIVLNSTSSNYLGDITWSYFAQGMYLGTRTGAFTANKTGYIYPGCLANGFMNISEWSPLNQILIETKVLNAGNLSSYNGALNKTLITIRVRN
jgi:hypothetical protein